MTRRGAPVRLLAGLLGSLVVLQVQAQLVNRPTTVWGEIATDAPQTFLGGTELLSFLLIIQLALLGAFGIFLLRSWHRLGLSRRAAGSEILSLYDQGEADQRRLSALAYGLLPLVTVLLILLGAGRRLWGIPLPHISLGLFWFSCLVAGAAFLMLEAVRRALGSPRLKR